MNVFTNILFFKNPLSQLLGIYIINNITLRYNVGYDKPVAGLEGDSISKKGHFVSTLSALFVFPLIKKGGDLLT